MKQKTIKNEIFLEGVGVHSGSYSSIRLIPAKPDSGIIITNINQDLTPIKIGTFYPEPAMHATIIKGNGWAVSTVEHLLSAIWCLGVDNIQIELKGVEIPILDGSALPFVQALKKAEIVPQSEKKTFVTPKRLIRFEEDDKFLEIEPFCDESQKLEFFYSIDFEHPLVIGNQIKGTLSENFFETDIAPARTFGFLSQLPFLRKHNLAQGTTLGNTVVIGENSLLNNHRFENEFIRHKLLDLFGDLALLGKPLVGKIRAHKTGHSFNRNVAKHFIENREMWQTL